MVCRDISSTLENIFNSDVIVDNDIELVAPIIGKREPLKIPIFISWDIDLYAI